MVAITTILLAWGALSFGGVYPWAYSALAAGVVLSALWTARYASTGKPGPVLIAFGLVVMAAGAQVVSLPQATLEQLSPRAIEFLRSINLAYASGVVDAHPLSIEPSRTLLALGFVLLTATWAWVCACAAQRNVPFARSLARNVAAIGILLAIIGLAQKATFNGKLLWFWEPRFYSWNAFGPFVNRNHFAGWMLLALMLSIGYLFGRLSTHAPSSRASWRNRLLWMGSPEGTGVFLIAVGILVMGCSLVWTMSRSGIVGSSVGLSMLFAAAVYRSKRRALRAALAGYLLLAVVALVAWRGTDTLFAWYGNTQTLEWRLDLWHDTLPAVRDFWLTGSGLNTYGTLMLVYPRTHMSSMPREAHNDYLQLAVEGGMLLCIPVLLLAVTVGGQIVQRLMHPQDETTWWIRMGASAGMCGIAIQELTEFSLQIPGIALLFATCVGLAVHQPPPMRSRGTKGRTG